MAKRTQAILNRALELIDSVPYKPSLRWLFYGLLQEGYYTKEAYKSFISLTARYRKNFLAGWHPNILADDTRGRIYQTGGYINIEQCFADLVESTVDSIRFDIDHFYQQEYYVEIWFEAKGYVWAVQVFHSRH